MNLKNGNKRMLTTFTVLAIFVLASTQIAHSNSTTISSVKPTIYQKPNAATLAASFHKAVMESKNEILQSIQQLNKKSHEVLPLYTPTLANFIAAAYANKAGDTSDFSNVDGLVGNTDGSRMWLYTYNGGDGVEAVGTMDGWSGGEIWINAGYANSHSSWENYVGVWVSSYGNDWNLRGTVQCKTPSTDGEWLDIADAGIPFQFVGIACYSIPGYTMRNDVEIDALGTTISYDQCWVNVAARDTTYNSPLNTGGVGVWIYGQYAGTTDCYLPIACGACSDIRVEDPTLNANFAFYIFSSQEWLDPNGLFTYNNPVNFYDYATTSPAWITAMYTYQ